MGTSVRPRSERLVRTVRTSELLGRLSEEELAAVLGFARTVHAGRGQPLARHDDDAVLLLLDGVAIATVPSDDGYQVVTELLRPGSVAGLPVALGQPAGGTDLAALLPTDALWFPGPEFRRHLTDLPALALSALRILAAEVAVCRREVARFAASSTTERVVDRLLELVDTWGQPYSDGTIRVVIPLTQEMLASWAQTSRESTAKVLHDLRKAGLIRTARRELTVLDPDRLRTKRAPTADQPDEVLRSLLRSIG
jgi:CRP/FNR family transcriptional regulator, cyclic AMP receptor protein